MKVYVDLLFILTEVVHFFFHYAGVFKVAAKTQTQTPTARI